MAAGAIAEPYVIPDAVQFLVQKERERIIAQMDSATDNCSYKAAVEQYLAWREQLKQVEDFMSHFGISYY